jgi:hypothetical protein
MAPWIIHIFSTTMNSPWINNIGPTLQNETVLGDYSEQDVRYLFKQKMAASHPASDLRGVCGTHHGTLPTMDYVQVCGGVLYLRTKGYPLSNSSINTALPFVGRMCTGMSKEDGWGKQSEA